MHVFMSTGGLNQRDVSPCMPSFLLRKGSSIQYVSQFIVLFNPLFPLIIKSVKFMHYFSWGIFFDTLFLPSVRTSYIASPYRRPSCPSSLLNHFLQQNAPSRLSLQNAMTFVDGVAVRLADNIGLTHLLLQL